MSYTIKGSNKRVARIRRHKRIRNKISGTHDCPRLVVTRTNRNVFIQLIDDDNQITLASASTIENDLRNLGVNKTEKSLKAGALIASRALALGFNSIVFDRGGYKYHGRIAAVAEGARQGGLKF